MRYYNIVCGNGWEWSSHPGGQYDPGALQVEFMIELYATPDPTPNSTIEIHGIPWDYIKYTNTLIDTQCTVYGGMAQGLQLASFQARNAGFQATGKIFKAWGNWIGTNMSIGMQLVIAGNSDSGGGGGASPSGDAGGGGGGDGASAGGQSVQAARNTRFKRTGPRSIFNNPSVGTLDSVSSITPPLTDLTLEQITEAVAGKGTIPNLIGSELPNMTAGGFPGLTNPLNLTWNLQPNQSFNSAISETLNRALPGVPLNVAVSPSLKLPYQDAGMYQNIEQFVGHLRDLSQSILGAVQGKQNYIGIHASSDGRSLDIWDGTVQFGSKYIDPLDLIGQPTWIDRFTVQIKVVMRGNIKPNDLIVLPDTLVNVNQGAIFIGQSTQRSHLSLSGNYIVKIVRHIGDFRNPDGNNWCTIIDAWPEELVVGPANTAIFTQTFSLAEINSANIAIGTALQAEQLRYLLQHQGQQQQSVTQRLMQRQVRRYG